MVVVKLDHTKALRVGYLIAEHGRAFASGCSGLQHIAQALAAVDVIAERQAHTVLTNEIFADDKGLSEDVPNTRQHEDRQRVVDHGLVVHREELFGYAPCDWV